MDVRIDQPIASTGRSTTIGLMFHDVTDSPTDSGFLQPSAQKYKHTTRQFRDYLQVVADSQFNVLRSAEDANSRLHSPLNTIFTFDDGGLSAMTAADMLEEHNWRGTFLVTTDLIATRGFLNQSQVRELHDRGHVIGTHSCDHPDIFRVLSRSAKFDQWNNSRGVLQQIIGAAVDVASVPGGDMDAATIEEAGAAGIKSLFTSELAATPWNHAGVTCFGRAWMLRSTSPHALSRWLRHPRWGLVPERGVRIAKNAARALMAPVYQRMMRQRRAVHEQS